jgi:AP-3 complex subunit beta
MVLHMIGFKLCSLIDETETPAARAAIVWCAGEYYHLIPEFAPDVLRIVSKKFYKEADEVKLASITTAVKLYIHIVVDPQAEDNDELVGKEQIPQLLAHILEVASFDTSYDIRDRARFIQRLVLGSIETNEPVAPTLAKLSILKKMFASEKPMPNIAPAEEETQVSIIFLLCSVVH